MIRRLRRVRFLAIAIAFLGLPVLAQPAWNSVPQPPSPEVAAAEQRVSGADESLSEAREELAGIDAERVLAQEGLSRRARAFYRLRRAGMTPVRGGFDAMLTHLSRMERLERMVRRDVHALRRVDARETELRGRVAELEEAAQEAERVAETMRAQNTQELQVAQAYSGLFAGTNRLPVVPLPPGGYGLTVRGAPAAPGFATLRGNLPLPVSSGGDVRDATREDGRGLEFSTSIGSRVTAVAGGTVAFARPYGRYGSMVVVDHGDSHYTVYAGLDRIEVSVGQRLQARQSVGQSSGVLYFEVRSGTRSVNAREWVGI